MDIESYDALAGIDPSFDFAFHYHYKNGRLPMVCLVDGHFSLTLVVLSVGPA